MFYSQAQHTMGHFLKYCQTGVLSVLGADVSGRQCMKIMTKV